MKVRELYLADNFSKLNLVSIPFPISMKRSDVIDRVRFILRAAEIREDLDEEMAYVCYKEFLNRFKQILHSSNGNEKKYLNRFITPDHALRVLEKLEKLAKNLCDRYDKRRKAMQKKLTELEHPPELTSGLLVRPDNDQGLDKAEESKSIDTVR